MTNLFLPLSLVLLLRTLLFVDIVDIVDIVYQSITDACIDLDTTATVLRDLAASVRAGRETRQ